MWTYWAAIVARPHSAFKAQLFAGLIKFLAIVFGLLIFAFPAQAQIATGGSGRYRDNIVWVNWGADGTIINQGGGTKTTQVNFGGQILAVTCTATNISDTTGSANDPDLISYRSGNWGGDAFDDLYNIGGTDGSNSLVVSVANRNDATTVTFDFNCTATLGPTGTSADPVFPMQGLVFADAEQSAAGPNEYIELTVPVGATFRMLDRYATSGCSNAGPLIVSADGRTVKFAGATLCATGPAGVGYIDGATSGRVTFKGGGYSAVALGAMTAFVDVGDAPTSYGQAAHVAVPTITGGTVPAGTTTNYMTTGLLNVSFNGTKLGATIDTDEGSLSGAAANGDDLNQSDDEDSLATAPNVVVTPGTNYTLSGVTCTGSGTIHGYIDFNRNGTFADSGERSSATTCSGGTANLVWAVPAIANVSTGASYLRLRIADVAAQTAAASGPAFSGEVEDYPVYVAIITPTTELGFATAGTVSTAIANVASNDTVNGVAATLGASGNATVAQSGTWPTGISLNTTSGAITVSSSVQPGVYQVSYQLCDKNTPANCATVSDTIFVNGTLTPTSPASPATCAVSGSWKQLMLDNALTGSNSNGVTATATLTGPFSYVGNDNQPLVFDSSEYTMGSTPIPLTASRYTIGAPSVLQTTPALMRWNFSQTPVRELRLHYNSVDNVRLLFNAAANPDIGWTVLSSVRTSNLTNVPNLDLGDNDVRDGDNSFADAYADGTSGGLSADGTVRFYSLSGNPITQLTLNWGDQAAKDALDIGFLALEACGFRPIIADDDSISGVNGAVGANDALNAFDGDTLGGVAVTTTTINVSVVTPATPINGGAVPVLGSDGLVDIPAGTRAGTYTIDYKICETANALNCDTATITVIVAPSADLAINKTDGTTIVTSGGTTTYTLTVTNNGPDSVTGAVVKDIPSTGITCPAGNAVTISGDGVPAGSFTIGDLTGAGIALGTLTMNQSAMLTFSCQVN